MTAVDDVSIEVHDGEFVVLLGSSGSGKSTLLRMVAGIESPDEGTILLDGRRVDELLPSARNIAMVFQSYALYPHMSVFSNLAFPLQSERLGRSEIKARIDEVAELLGLEALLRRRPGQLSGGQQQRVALGRAIVRRPALFLLDEPLSNLDAKLRARTRLDLARLHKRLAATTLHVTHDQVEALTMGDRIAVLDEGTLRQYDTPEAVYDHPADTGVAEFVGSPPMNLLEATAGLRGGCLTLDGTGWSWRAAAESLHPLVRAALAGLEPEVMVGVRPEHLSLAPPGSDGTVPGVVERVELLGNERVVHLVVAARTCAVRVPTGVRPDEGERCGLRLDPTGVRLFSKATGRNVTDAAART